MRWRCGKFDLKVKLAETVVGIRGYRSGETKKVGAIFVPFCPHLSIYAREDLNQFKIKTLSAPGGIRTPNFWLRRPTLSSLRVFVFIILKAVFIFAGCDLGAKVSTKSALKMKKYEYMQLTT